MLSLKCLTKKFNKQSLSEVKPAPPSETVDNTYPSPPPNSKPITASHHLTMTTSPADHTPTGSSPSPHGFLGSSPGPAPLSDKHAFITSTDVQPNQPHPFVITGTNPPPDSCMFTLSSSPISFSSPSSSPPVASHAHSPSPSSSDSEDTEDEDESLPLSRAKCSPFTRARVQSPRRSLHTSELSSAEKRKYSQYKSSTGGSSPSSSDDEIKEAFGSGCASSLRRHHTHHHHARHHQQQRQPGHTLPAHAWAWGGHTPNTSVTTNFTSPAFSASGSSPSSGASSESPSLSVDPFEAAGRPLKVVPVGGRHTHKFFAQMSSTRFSDRPFLDFNKMQHKRLVMVRRPMVIRNNSRVHSIQRPPPSSLQVSLDISQHSFQPVLTQT